MVKKSHLISISEALVRTSIVGIGLYLGEGFGTTVVTGLGINLSSALLDNGLSKLKEKWLSSSDGILNHDIQQALVRAFIKTLDSLEKKYFALEETVELPKEKKDAIKSLFQELKDETDTIFLPSIEKAANDEEIKGYLFGDREEAKISLWNRLEDTNLIYTYYGEHFKNFLRENSLDEIVFWFGEELKTDSKENNRAWRAFQRMLLEGIQADVKLVRANQEFIRQDLKVLDGIKTQLDALNNTINRRAKDEPFQQGLEQGLFRIGDVFKGIAAIATGTDNKVDVLIDVTQRTEEKIDASIRRDLRAKMTRAQELHARDESKQALALLGEVYHIARSHGLKQEQLEALLNLAFATSVKHDFKTVDRKFHEAEKLIWDVKDPWNQIQFYRLKSRVFGHKKRVMQAEKALRKAIELSRSDDQGVVEVGLLARTDYIHLLCDAKRLDEADEHISFVREMVEGTKDNHSVGLIAELVAACVHWAISKGDLKQVKIFVDAAIKQGAGKEAALCISHTLHDCANGARGMKATEVAVICADAAERLGHIAQRPDMALAAAYTAAGALAENHDFHAARERCLRLVEMAKAVNEPKLRLCVFQLLSQTSRQLGDRTTAVEAAEAALRDTEGESTGLCIANMTFAEALRDCGRVKEAMDHARTAYDFSDHCDLPPEWVDETLVLVADCAARLGDWVAAEKYSVLLAKRSPATRGSKNRRMLVENRIQMHKMVRESLTSVISESSPISVARTEAAETLQAANAMVLNSTIEAWKEYPNAASALYDYWGRGNLLRVMLNMRAFPNTFNMTLEVHSVQEARQAVRLWALIADVLVLIWKGPTVSSHVICPVPGSFRTGGGGGYIVAPSRDGAMAPLDVTGRSPWKVKRSEEMLGIITTKWASLLPDDVAHFLTEEAAPLMSMGRLIVVPSTGICCVGAGHGPLESLFAEACNAMPAIKGDATGFPASWVPYFPDIPLDVLAKVVRDQELSMSRLRVLLMRKTREFRSSGITGGEAKELELELQDSLAQINERQGVLRHKYGWGEAREPVASRYDGFNEQNIGPILVLQRMGYRWRVEHAIGGSMPENELLPKSNEPVGTWLHPPDSKPYFPNAKEISDFQNKLKPRRKR